MTKEDNVELATRALAVHHLSQSTIDIPRPQVTPNVHEDTAMEENNKLREPSLELSGTLSSSKKREPQQQLGGGKLKRPKPQANLDGDNQVARLRGRWSPFQIPDSPERPRRSRRPHVAIPLHEVPVGLSMGSVVKEPQVTDLNESNNQSGVAVNNANAVSPPVLRRPGRPPKNRQSSTHPVTTSKGNASSTIMVEAVPRAASKALNQPRASPEQRVVENSRDGSAGPFQPHAGKARRPRKEPGSTEPASAVKVNKSSQEAGRRRRQPASTEPAPVVKARRSNHPVRRRQQDDKGDETVGKLAETPEADDDRSSSEDSQDKVYQPGTERQMRSDQVQEHFANSEDGSLGSAATNHDLEMRAELEAWPEMFGMEGVWEKVIEAARSVKTEGEGSDPSTSTTHFQTRRFDAVISAIGKAQRYFATLSANHESDRPGNIDGDGDNDDGEDDWTMSQDQLEKLFDRIEECIKNLRQDSSSTKNRKRLRCIYGHVIPELVFLLESALSVRTPVYSVCDDETALEEVIRIQAMLVSICSKTRKWNDQPTNSNPPVIKPTRFVILPGSRKILAAFEEELQKRKRKRKQAQREAAKREKMRRWQADELAKIAEKQASKQRKLRASAADAIRNREFDRRRFGLPPSPGAQRSTSQTLKVLTRPKSSREEVEQQEEQNLELVRLLGELDDRPSKLLSVMPPYLRSYMLMESTS